ncbi:MULTISPECIES: ABC transporter permease [Streptomyces]|uniref:ABC transporter permease n=1 Tax=Streptomyces TaxID=1883 RepID=UPI0004AB7BB7|nr:MULTISPECIES: ABC transporter permease [Streptomyces]
MSSTDTAAVLEKDASDSAEVGAGLDVLDGVAARGAPIARIVRERALPPLIVVGLVLGLWQLVFVLGLTDADKLPGPAMVWHSLDELWCQETLLPIVWTSVWRGLSGFLLAVVIGTPIGLVVARVKPVRTAIGPVLQGLQSLPSVAWVPAAVIWLGPDNVAIYAVILLGSVPSVANGLVAGIDQVPPLFLRAGRTMGATGLAGVRHVLIPAALPGYLAGLKQGWAFSWRSLMAAELIASSPELGLGRYLQSRREAADMPGVLLGILLILIVGIAIELAFMAPIERHLLRDRGVQDADR